jgi:hypothetical protein
MFGNETQPGNLPEGIRDRTMCFADAMDPFVIEIAALPPDQAAVEPNPPPVTPQEAGLEGDKAAVTDAGGEKSGGCMQLSHGSTVPSTAWMWFAALGITGWIAGRRFKVGGR